MFLTNRYKRHKYKSQQVQKVALERKCLRYSCQTVTQVTITVEGQL